MILTHMGNDFAPRTSWRIVTISTSSLVIETQNQSVRSRNMVVDGELVAEQPNKRISQNRFHREPIYSCLIDL